MLHTRILTSLSPSRYKKKKKMCGKNNESIDHLFLHYVVAPKFWSWLVEEAGLDWVIQWFWGHEPIGF